MICYIFCIVWSIVPKFQLDEVFICKEEIVIDIKQKLTKTLQPFNYCIVRILNQLCILVKSKFTILFFVYWCYNKIDAIRFRAIILAIIILASSSYLEQIEFTKNIVVLDICLAAWARAVCKRMSGSECISKESGCKLDNSVWVNSSTRVVKIFSFYALAL